MFVVKVPQRHDNKLTITDFKDQNLCLKKK